METWASDAITRHWGNWAETAGKLGTGKLGTGQLIIVDSRKTEIY